MAACLVLGIATVRRGDIAAHRVWMIRAYAIALAAGTQAFTVGIGQAVFGTACSSATCLSVRAGWSTSPWPSGSSDGRRGRVPS